MGRPVQTVIIDHNEIFRRGLRALLEETGEFVVVAEGGTVEAARRIMETEHPDVATIDLDLGDGDGIQLVRECLATGASTSCVLLGAATRGRTKLSALLVGAAGVIDRDGDPADVVAAIRAVACGESLFGENAAQHLLEDIDDEPVDDLAATLRRLTPQETRVFELVGQGLTNREVAGHLFLTEKTVKNYVSRVLTKLGMHHRTEIAVLATRLAARREPARGRRRPVAHA